MVNRINSKSQGIFLSFRRAKLFFKMQVYHVMLHVIELIYSATVTSPAARQKCHGCCNGKQTHDCCSIGVLHIADQHDPETDDFQHDPISSSSVKDTSLGITLLLLLNVFVNEPICRHNMTNRGLGGHATELIKSKSVNVST